MTLKLNDFSRCNFQTRFNFFVQLCGSQPLILQVGMTVSRTTIMIIQPTTNLAIASRSYVSESAYILHSCMSSRNHAMLCVSWNLHSCCTTARKKIAFEKACTRPKWMTFKVIQGHCILFSSLVAYHYVPLLHFAWVVDDEKCIVVTRVCVSVCVCVCVCPRPYAHTTARTRM